MLISRSCLVSPSRYVRIFTATLTYAFVTDLSPLLGAQCAHAILDPQKLDESVRLLDRYLCNLSEMMEDVEDVTFRDLFARKVPWRGCQLDGE